MGTWGYEPWDNDEAADWYGEFFDDLKVNEIQSIVDKFDLTDELKYEPIRAAAYVVQTLCNAYVWPTKDGDEPRILIAKLIHILEKMIDPSEKDCTFLEMWDFSPEIIDSVNRQVAMLKVRHSEWAGSRDWDGR